MDKYGKIPNLEEEGITLNSLNDIIDFYTDERISNTTHTESLMANFRFLFIRYYCEKLSGNKSEEISKVRTILNNIVKHQDDIMISSNPFRDWLKYDKPCGIYTPELESNTRRYRQLSEKLKEERESKSL